MKIFSKLFNGNKIKTSKLKALTQGPTYKVIDPIDSLQRRGSIAENKGEDMILTHPNRMKMINLVRNQVRNSPTMNILLKQLENNVLGSSAGKLIWTGQENDDAKKLQDLFWSWTHSAEFFDGLSFLELLKVAYKSILINGDIVLLMDDGYVSDNGKLMIFEADEIGDLSDEDVHRYYGKGCSSSQGRITDAYGRFAGVVVSKSQRAKDVFDPARSYCLRYDQDADHFSSKFLMPRLLWRTNQGRGVTCFSSCIGACQDLEETLTAEVLSAKKNSQLLGKITSSAQAEVEVPTQFSDTDFAQMTDEEIRQAVKEESQQTQALTFDPVHSIGANIIQLPDNYNLDLLDSKRPNPNMPAFIDFLASRVVGPIGISQMYATGNPGSNFDAETLMSWSTFAAEQKKIEQIADWVIFRLVEIWDRQGRLDKRNLGENWLKHVKWNAPKMNEVDGLSMANATAKRFETRTTTYQQELGPNWKGILTQMAEEQKWARENGIVLGYDLMKSGGQVELERE